MATPKHFARVGTRQGIHGGPMVIPVFVQASHLPEVVRCAASVRIEKKRPRGIWWVAGHA